MEDKAFPSRSYYGELKGSKLKGQNLSMYGVEEAYARIIEKHENRLNDSVNKLIESARDTFKNEIKRFEKELRLLHLKFEKIERYVNGKIALENKIKEKELLDKKQLEKIKAVKLKVNNTKKVKLKDFHNGL